MERYIIILPKEQKAKVADGHGTENMKKEQAKQFIAEKYLNFINEFTGKEMPNMKVAYNPETYQVQFISKNKTSMWIDIETAYNFIISEGGK